MFHMLAFGASGFFMAYSSKGPDLSFVYMHGGIAIFVYLIFYLTLFGLDEVKWMFINAGLGILAIYSQIDWLLSFFGKQASDYPFQVHVIPFLYFILYTFLLRQFILDLTGSRDDETKKHKVEYGYVAASIIIYLVSYMFHSADRPATATSSPESSTHYVVPGGQNIDAIKTSKKPSVTTSRSNSSSFYVVPTGENPYTGKPPEDSIMAALRKGDYYWDKYKYNESYLSYKQAYKEASALDDSDATRNRKLAFSSSGIMATACVLHRWEEADAAMAELKQRYENLSPEDKKKMDYWIRTGDPRLKDRKC